MAEVSGNKVTRWLAAVLLVALLSAIVWTLRGWLGLEGQPAPVTLNKPTETLVPATQPLTEPDPQPPDEPQPPPQVVPRPSGLVEGVYRTREVYANAGPLTLKATTDARGRQSFYIGPRGKPDIDPDDLYLSTAVTWPDLPAGMAAFQTAMARHDLSPDQVRELAKLKWVGQVTVPADDRERLQGLYRAREAAGDSASREALLSELVRVGTPLATAHKSAHLANVEQIKRVLTPSQVATIVEKSLHRQTAARREAGLLGPAATLPTTTPVAPIYADGIVRRDCISVVTPDGVLTWLRVNTEVPSLSSHCPRPVAVNSARAGILTLPGNASRAKQLGLTQDQAARLRNLSLAAVNTNDYIPQREQILADIALWDKAADGSPERAAVADRLLALARTAPLAASARYAAVADERIKQAEAILSPQQLTDYRRLGRAPPVP
jgi:hypothetical protein